MQICEKTNEELIGVADDCSVLAKQFDEDSAVATALTSAVAAIRELLFYRRLDDRPDGGAKIYLSSPFDHPGIARLGEPLPRPFVVAILPYAKWLILESSASRVENAEAAAKAMTDSSARNAALADGFEKLYIVEREKNAATINP
ncbi:MAG: hypothetical protein BGO25_05725 [Acidobacteriales bacterium 59-55]|nr:hypothetical protein [Terriglobales bacterium]ODU54622.1 MAG: hypothetical protein ABT04_02505 [Granulicella sp. SCN 62-9]OJV44582.1 MAG: hypothetical protein BGO25_05725 [Acidobacteriales bacterium 59-55]